MKKLALAVTLTLFCLSVEGQAQISTADLLLEDNAGNPLVTLTAPSSGTAYTFLFPSAPGIFSNATGGLLFVSGATGSDMQTSVLLPGTDGQTLQIDNGVPAWKSVNTLPAGSTTNSTLIWNGTNWVENTNVTMTPGGDITNAGNTSTTGNTTVGGNLTVSGDVILANGVINNNELENDDVTVNAGTGLSGGGTVVLGGSITLNNDGILDVVGTTNQVNVAKAAGVATLSTPQDIHTGASPTFNGMTLTGLTGPSTATDIVVSNGGVLETIPVSSLPSSGGGEPYVTFGAGSASLTNNRIATAGTGIDIVDAGSDNGALTINNTGLLGAAAGTGISVTTTSQVATITNTGVTNISAGAGLSTTGSTGAITLTNTGVTSINGTANQVIASASTGAVTLSTPQDIHTAASPTFNGMTLTGLASDNSVATIVVSDGGILKTRAVTSLPGGSSGWALTGNASTSPATNFLGTTDAQPLVVRTNNTERMRVLSGGAVQVSSTTGATAEFRIAEPTTGGTDYSAFRTQAQPSSITYILPDTAGKDGDVLLVKSINTTTNEVTLDWDDANAGGGLGSIIFARKTADETYTTTNPIALQYDDHLELELKANTTYRVEVILYVDQLSTGSGALDFAIDVPTGSDMLFGVSGFEDKSGNSNTGNAIRDTDATGEINGGNNSGYNAIGLSSNNVVLLLINGIVITGSSAGDMKLMWAGTSNNDQIKIRKNSTISAAVFESQ